MRETLSERRETVHRAVRLLVVAWLAVMLLSAPAVAQTETATPTGETAPCATGPPVPGQGNETDGGAGQLEVALVNDRSQSMTEGTRLEDAKAAATGFVDRLEEPDEAAAISFGLGASVDQQLTTNYSAVTQAIENIEATDSNTDLGAGINTAHNELENGTNASPDANKVMIVLTDATNVDDTPRPEAEEAKESGITVIAVGVGNDVNEQLITDIATSEDYAYISPSSEDLDSIYQNITSQVEELGGELEIDTRSLYQPGATHGYEVNEITYLEDGRTTVTDVTENATVTTTNSTLLSVNEANNTLSATTDANTSTWVRVDATHNGSTGCTNVIVAEPTVENLQLVPGIWRFFAVFDDATMFTLLIAALLSVPAARFTSAFGGLAVAEMVIVIGWVTGRIAFGFAAVSVFVALFIGLNLAANIDYQVRR